MLERVRRARDAVLGIAVLISLPRSTFLGYPIYFAPPRMLLSLRMLVSLPLSPLPFLKWSSIFTACVYFLDSLGQVPQTKVLETTEMH